MSSTSQTPPGSVPGASPAAGASSSDPSMEDILASIRRILSEDEVTPAGAGSDEQAASPEPRDTSEGLLVLDPSMMVSEASDGTAAAPEPAPVPPMAPVP